MNVPVSLEFREQRVDGTRARRSPAAAPKLAKETVSMLLSFFEQCEDEAAQFASFAPYVQRPLSPSGSAHGSKLNFQAAA